MNPILLTDAYKISHPKQYPAGTEYVYSNVTPRKSMVKDIDSVVVFGVQYFIIKYLLDEFNQNFFKRPKQEVTAELKQFFDSYFGPGSVDISIYEDLWELGYLPLRIKALPEGTKCPIGVPFMTIENTHPKFYWLTNFIETMSQSVLWNMITSATIADRMRRVLENYADETCEDRSFVPFQGHNFSMRGMSSLESAASTDLGHLLSFVGSDTLPGNYLASQYYGGFSGLISCSVPATEHAVMCAGGKDSEYDTFKRLITETYPNGIVSIVSDTWDLWKVCTEILPRLKDEILARDGKVVIRPDSGIPEHIIGGYVCAKTNHDSAFMQARVHSINASLIETGVEVYLCSDGKYVRMIDGKILSEPEVKGVVALLGEVFGYTENKKGFKELNPKVGVIYGDGITYDVANRMLNRLAESGWASNNVVLGIGSFTYQYNTRDTFGIACKATWVQINGEGIPCFKDPVTDNGTKKSAVGLLAVVEGDDGKLKCKMDVSRDEEVNGTLLTTVFEDGYRTMHYSLADIREILRSQSGTTNPSL